MKFIDFHSDTLYRLFYQENRELGDLWENSCHVSLEHLRRSGYTAQMFACFLNLAKKPRLGSHYQDVLGMIDLFYQQTCGYEDKVRFAGSFQDYAENQKQGILSGFLTLEEGGVLENRMERLDELYEKGIRVINMTWNHENCLGYPHNAPHSGHRGLKPFGFEVLERMDELGIVADVSHLSDEGFQDIIRYGRRPVIATHSDARSLRAVSRNLSDAMIRQIADCGGIIGVNFYSDFLSDDPVSRISDIIRHCRHIINVGGEEVLGIGADFDGMDIELEINGVQDIGKLTEAMAANGFSERQAELICYRNAENFFYRYWGDSV